MRECACDFRTRMVGDGCEVCNPAKALEYAKQTIADLEEVIADYRRLVRELDVLLNGSGAAQQASLCDIVAQVARSHREFLRSTDANA